ncbi:alpha/beta hydrolase [Nocardioides sp. YIM 152315]|uniref:alpha/beta fold hydrolase n=1 Tax=Nocardioides sp. YIM 152315 TaxID=3031760 RepID=UPI0023DB1EDE|nr:alpha/beta hydrolase [Nocardioides sp. YIM 152315]MDF1602044.1 alpha/beta hydrolase [Nocardioides sp. YIM 152315]
MTRRDHITPTATNRRRVALPIVLAALALLLASLVPVQTAGAQRAAAAGRSPEKPTIVLVHGAWADASNWTRVVIRLQRDGYRVYAIANPLRSLSGDAASVRAFLQTIKGPVVLVGHSYGGAVITNAATGLPNVEALVYVNAFAPDEGESAIALAGPESALSVADPTTVFDFVPRTLPPTPDTDLYLKRSTVLRSFATGLNAVDKAVAAASQRPATLGALSEPSGPPAWRTIRSWYLIGANDKIVPPGVEETMAERAGSKVVHYDAGHLGLISEPLTVSRVIERAAKAVASAR